MGYKTHSLSQHDHHTIQLRLSLSLSLIYNFPLLLSFFWWIASCFTTLLYFFSICRPPLSLSCFWCKKIYKEGKSGKKFLLEKGSSWGLWWWYGIPSASVILASAFTLINYIVHTLQGRVLKKYIVCVSLSCQAKQEWKSCCWWWWWRWCMV